MAPTTTTERHRIRGVYTKTIITSPVVHWILHTRILDEDHDNVIFVGENFIHVKLLEAQGHLRHVATKDDFGSQIRAASTFSTRPKTPTDDIFVKPDPDGGNFPPEMLVLVLDSDELLFLSLLPHEDGTCRFWCRDLPLPSFDRAMFRLGEHLCVDPSSRAIATAAMERELFIGSIGIPLPERADSPGDSQDWRPISCQRSLKIDGVIQNMSFLTPQAGDEDHAILLLIVTDSKMTRAMWVDWYHSTGIESLQLHSGQALNDTISTSNILVPLKNASFLLSKGQEIVRWRNLLSGSADSSIIPVDVVEPKSEPSLKYAWANWVLPCRYPSSRREKDVVYLAREDGLVFLLSIDGKDSAEVSIAGDLECHIGTAFASLGNDRDPDILAVGGDMSNGRIVAIGAWSDHGVAENQSWREAMSMYTTQSLPNWASSLDMIPSQSRHGHTVYMTAGREPHGSIVELRRGVELKASVRFPLSNLKSVINVWALPQPSSESTLIIISGPTTTNFLSISSDANDEAEVAWLDEGIVVETSQQTLAAGTLSSQHLVQITPHSVSIVISLHHDHEDLVCIPIEHDSEILAATIITERDLVVFAQSTNQGFSVCCASLIPEKMDRENCSRTFSNPTVTQSIDSKPLCISAMFVGQLLVIATTTMSNRLAVILVTEGVSSIFYEDLPTTEGDSISVCDQISVLRPSDQVDIGTELLAVCGLRDGRIVTYHIEPGRTPPIGASDQMEFGNSTVKLVQHDPDNLCSIAISGTDCCRLEWTGRTPELSIVQNIWLSDSSDPGFNQTGVIACDMMPSLHSSSSNLSGAMIMVCEDEILIGTLDRLPTTIPRRIPVDGTPNRLIYLDEYQCFVCSAERSRTFTSRGTQAMKRQRWPVIHFIPYKQNRPSLSYDMQPGERVNALLSWSYRSSEGKVYSYVLIGGSYHRPNGVNKGRVSMLQPKKLRDRQVVGFIGDPYHLKFDQEVSALGEYDPTTFIVCAGHLVYLYHFAVDLKKWRQHCVPFRLPSPGIWVTTHVIREHDKLITISTARDSIIVLRRQPIESEGQPEHEYELIPVFMAPTTEVSHCHLAFRRDEAQSSDIEPENIILLSTKDARLVGLKCVETDKTSSTNNVFVNATREVEVIFTGNLSGSLRRIRRCDPLPRKGNSPGGFSHHRIVGSMTDGAIIGIVLLEQRVCERLVWLQQLCRWNEGRRTDEHLVQPYGADVEMSDGPPMPVKLRKGNESALWGPYSEDESHMHINGDIVSQILDRDGAAAIKRSIREIALRDDLVGRWVRDREEEEIKAVDQTAEWIRRLNDWM